MTSRTPDVLLAALLFACAAPAQDYRPEQLAEVGIELQVFRKLQQIPMRLGAQELHLRAKFEPHDAGDKIHGKLGTYLWYLNVYVFGEDPANSAAAPTTGDDPDAPKTREQAEAEARAEVLARYRARHFEEFVRSAEKDPQYSRREFKVEKQTKKGSSKRPGYDWWEYYDVDKVTVGGQSHDLVWYHFAAVFDVHGKEVAVVCTIPIAKSGYEIDRKYERIAQRMLTSVRILEPTEEEAGEDEARDQHAVTEQQKAELERLKANIRGFDNWDYFTTPNFIVAYSWAKGKPQERRESLEFAREMGQALEDIRELFEKHYPPHDKMQTSYSVIRVCGDYTDFEKYSGMGGGVVGWFSPTTKELCIFNDKDHYFPDSEFTLAVCYHEAWHQYSDQYWPGVELHRWFDEGLAEYFGTWRKKGRNWQYEYHKNRYDSVRQQIREGKLIPSAEIITWHKDKFYGARAADHYAQAWVMVDFLKRGKDVLRSRWNSDWDKILETYARVCLEEKSEKKAVEAAFEGIDIAAFEAAWLEWFERNHIRKG